MTTQNGEESCHFEWFFFDLLNFERCYFSFSLRLVMWSNRQLKKTRGHVDHLWNSNLRLDCLILQISKFSLYLLAYCWYLLYLNSIVVNLKKEIDLHTYSFYLFTLHNIVFTNVTKDKVLVFQDLIFTNSPSLQSNKTQSSPLGSPSIQLTYVSGFVNCSPDCHTNSPS